MAEHKIAERDMIRLVEEVSKLENERQQMLDKTQVATILNELNLPSDLLDDALERLERKQAKESRKKSVLIAGVAAGLLGGLIALIVGMSASNLATEYNNISASDARIAQSADSVETLSKVKAGELIFVNATLHNVPLHKKLPLHAKWFRPDGSIFHENSWQTRDTTSSTWNTHAKATIPEGVPAGKWTVQISIGDRELISKVFIVE